MWITRPHIEVICSYEADMQRVYNTRSRPTPQTGNWAIAAPAAGPGFVSTAFRYRTGILAQTADIVPTKTCAGKTRYALAGWQDSKPRQSNAGRNLWASLAVAARSALCSIQRILEIVKAKLPSSALVNCWSFQAERPDLDASDLRLPSLKEAVSSIVEQKLQKEQDPVKAAARNDSAKDPIPADAVQQASEVQPQGSVKDRGRSKRGRGKQKAVLNPEEAVTNAGRQPSNRLEQQNTTEQSEDGHYPANGNGNKKVFGSPQPVVAQPAIQQSGSNPPVGAAQLLEAIEGTEVAPENETAAVDHQALVLGQKNPGTIEQTAALINSGQLLERDGAGGETAANNGPAGIKGENREEKGTAAMVFEAQVLNGNEAEAAKGTKHWRPSGSLPNLIQAEGIAYVSQKGGRYKQEGYKKHVKRLTLPQFGGEANELETERRKAYEESSKDLQSVAAALENPFLHCTAFQIKPERVLTTAEVCQPKRTSGQTLSQDEAILRIEIREFDALHVTHQSLDMAVHGGFFYIEGVFYIDRRKSSVDYVRPIQEFCNEHGIAPPPEVGESAEAFPERNATSLGNSHAVPSQGYTQMDMARVSWKEIGLRVGPAAKNVYCHQGCCEHLLVIKDVRRIHPDDPPHLESYPHVIQEEAVYRRACDVCNESMAQKVTYDDKDAPQEPAFWCLDCYRMMHYDASNSLLYDHKVFEYHGG